MSKAKVFAFIFCTERNLKQAGVHGLTMIANVLHFFFQASVVTLDWIGELDCPKGM